MTSNMICNLETIPKIISDNNYAKSQNLKVKKISINDNNYFVIKYDKSKLTFDNTKTLGLFRSIITDGTKILSFAPQKSIDYTRFTNSNNILECYLEKYMEGTMINLFMDPYTNEWEITTRSIIGARAKFFRDAKFTFRYMFLEVLNSLGIDFNIFDKDKCYSFVLQHMENKIVIPHTLNNIYLTNVYKINEFKVHEIDAYEESKRLNIPYPDILQNNDTTWNISSWDDLENKLKDFDDANEYKFVGVVIKNSYGERSKIRNNAYEYVKKLKGNNPKMQYQYYSLRQHGAVSECLKFYPEYKDLFSEFRDNLHHWTKRLHQNYFDCFINKKAPIKDYPHQFKLHMWNLHQVYLNDLKPQGKYISYKEVINYVNKIHPAKLMYAINYIYRKVTQDEKTKEFNKHNQSNNTVNQTTDETMTDD